MCRIVFAVASGGEAVDALRKLVGLHLKASLYDPLLARITGEDGSHCHGYGYMLATRRGGGWVVRHSRLDAAPVLAGKEACQANIEAMEWEAAVLDALLEGVDDAVLLLHSRRASTGMPRGPMNAHPFKAEVLAPSLRGELYLAHNGSVDREALAGELGVDAGGYTDSHLLALWLARRLAAGAGLAEALGEGGAKFTRTAYIVGTVLLAGGRAELVAASILPEGLDSERREYYRPYILRAPGFSAVVSPTLVKIGGGALRGVSIEPFTGVSTIARLDYQEA